MSMHDTPAFKKFKEQRAAKGAATPTSEDEDYRRFLAAMSGAEGERMAGGAHEQIDGGARVPEHITNAEIYEGFVDMLSGEAGRRRARENVRQDFRDRREELRRHAEEMGTPLHPQYED